MSTHAPAAISQWEQQIAAIGQQGKLLQGLQFVAPDIDRHGESEEMRSAGRWSVGPP